MSDGAEWLRNLARNYADGVAGMAPQDHRAWDIADEVERLRAENDHFNAENEKAWNEIERLKAALRAILLAGSTGAVLMPEPLYEMARAALEGKP